jgi:hypothetical protein
MVLALQSIVPSIVKEKKSLRGGSEIWRRARSFGGRSVLTTQSRPAFRLVEVRSDSAPPDPRSWIRRGRSVLVPKAGRGLTQPVQRCCVLSSSSKARRCLLSQFTRVVWSLTNLMEDDGPVAICLKQPASPHWEHYEVLFCIPRSTQFSTPQDPFCNGTLSQLQVYSVTSFFVHNTDCGRYILPSLTQLQPQTTLGTRLRLPHSKGSRMQADRRWSYCVMVECVALERLASIHHDPIAQVPGALRDVDA